MTGLKDIQRLSQKLSVLYVEDDTCLANTVITYLSKLFKEVVYAKNGEDGLWLFEQDHFDVVITDLNMPKLHGLDMINKIKKIKTEQKIIILSASNEIKNLQDSIKMGIEGYIMKPINYVDMNNILYATTQKINIEKENKEYALQLNAMLIEQNHYTNALNKVAIVSKTDLKGTITYVNDYFCNVCGYSQEELLGQPHNIIRHPDMPKAAFKEMWDTIQSGQIWEGNVKNMAKNKEPYYVHATIIPLYDLRQKNIVEYIGIRFLTTNEENEKRNFKKKVMTTYQDQKKQNEVYKKRISALETELNILHLNEHATQMDQQYYKKKYLQALEQIDFLAQEVKNINEQYEKKLQIIANNNKKIGTTCKQSLQKIGVQNESIKFLKNENEAKSKALDKLNETILTQRKHLNNMKEVVQYYKEETKNSKEKGFFTTFRK